MPELPLKNIDLSSCLENFPPACWQREQWPGQDSEQREKVHQRPSLCLPPGQHPGPGIDGFIFFCAGKEQTQKIIVVERPISNVWSPFYNHSLGPHYGNFSSITGKLYNESDDKPASKAEICILIQCCTLFLAMSLEGQGLLIPGLPGPALPAPPLPLSGRAWSAQSCSILSESTISMFSALESARRALPCCILTEGYFRQEPEPASVSFSVK